MALAGDGVRAGGPQSDVKGTEPGEACMVRSNASWGPPEQTDMSDNSTFPQLGWLPTSLN